MTSKSELDDKAAIDKMKQAAANWAAEQLENGMVVGLGSGSTAKFAVARIGQLVQQGLQIVGIPTSEETAAQARELGIELSTLGKHAQIDVTIDGADEAQVSTLNLIKGGGGNHLREKIVASASKKLLIVVDERKVVDQLGTRAKVPVEVAQFGWQSTERRLKSLGGNPVLRLSKQNEPFVTDGGNYILDCGFGPINDPANLQRELDSTVGVVEHGLFINMAARVVVAKPEAVTFLEKKG
jgi:ribose 5-phosphate isomerase A